MHPRLTTLANAQNVGERLAERLGSHSHFQAADVAAGLESYEEAVRLLSAAGLGRMDLATRTPLRWLGKPHPA